MIYFNFKILWIKQVIVKKPTFFYLVISNIIETSEIFAPKPQDQCRFIVNIVRLYLVMLLILKKTTAKIH